METEVALPAAICACISPMDWKAGSSFARAMPAVARTAANTANFILSSPSLETAIGQRVGSLGQQVGRKECPFPASPDKGAYQLR